jgi:hypothetical protein
MKEWVYFFTALSIVTPNSLSAQEPQAPAQASAAHQGHVGMKMDMDGAVMNENYDKLPQDCQSLGGDYKFTVHAGKKHAEQFPEYVFAYDQREWNVDPCSRITITFINDDQVRHQFMLHGLPMYLYHQGMFHIEVNGGAQKTGTFIVPSTQRTYFVHCDMAQHTEKGLRAQLKVGGGNGDLPSVPGISGHPFPDTYDVRWTWTAFGVVAGASVLGLLTALGLLRKTTQSAE